MCKLDDCSRSHLEIAAENFDQIKTLQTDLQQALYSVSQNLYQQAGGGAAPGADPGADPGAGASSSGGGDDVIDADFTESK